MFCKSQVRISFSKELNPSGVFNSFLLAEVSLRKQLWSIAMLHFIAFKAECKRWLNTDAQERWCSFSVMFGFSWNGWRGLVPRAAFRWLKSMVILTVLWSQVSSLREESDWCSWQSQGAREEMQKKGTVRSYQKAVQQQGATSSHSHVSSKAPAALIP